MEAGIGKFRFKGTGWEPVQWTEGGVGLRDDSAPQEAGESMTKILVIDHQEGISDFQAQAFQRKIPGAFVFNAHSWNDVLKKVQKEKPDVIVCAVTLWDNAGFDTCKILKGDDATRLIPIVMVCPEGDIGDQVRGLESGADVFLTGPFEAARAAAQVNAVLRTRASFDLLKQQKESLSKEIGEKTRTLQEHKEDLAKRLKELDCFYRISELRERPGITLEEILQGVADLIPASLQHPEVTCARIFLGYQEFRTNNFRLTPWKQSCDIKVQGEWAGTLEVCYLERPPSDEYPFLKEEKFLLSAVAERLGRIAEREQAEDALRLESENLINILKSMEDWVYKVNEQFDLEYVNPALERELGDPAGWKCYEYFHNRRKHVQRK